MRLNAQNELITDHEMQAYWLANEEDEWVEQVTPRGNNQTILISLTLFNVEWGIVLDYKRFKRFDIHIQSVILN